MNVIEELQKLREEIKYIDKLAQTLELTTSGYITEKALGTAINNLAIRSRNLLGA